MAWRTRREDSAPTRRKILISALAVASAPVYTVAVVIVPWVTVLVIAPPVNVGV